MPGSVRVYVGLGANVGDAQATLTEAVAALAGLPGATLAGVSPLYRTKPVGVTDQPDFLNAVVALDVVAAPGDDPATKAASLLVQLKHLERVFGRRRRRRWGPRELDLDLLLYGDARLSIERPPEAAPLTTAIDPSATTRLLEVPHPSMANRLFVLAPLADLAPDLVPPGWSEPVGAAADRLRRAQPEAVARTGAWEAPAGRWRGDDEAPDDGHASDGGIDRSSTLALVVAMALLVTTGGRPGGETLAALTAVGATLAIATRWRVPMLAVAVLLLVGIGLRAALQVHTTSDVMDVIGAAIRLVAGGGNPYGIGYAVTRPPGSSYPYGPLALLWYAPFQERGWQLELIVGGAVLVLLAMRGKLLGLAIYATAPTIVATTGDGSNDTSAGFLLLVALVVARRRPVLGAFLLAVAVAFKPYLAAWAPAFLVWGGWTVAGVFLATSLVLWSPVIVVWGIPKFLKSLDLAAKAQARHLPAWSLGDLWRSVFHDQVSASRLETLRLVLGAAAAAVTLRWSRSLDGVILAGALVYLVTLYMGYWSTYAYFAAIAPILCWRIDDWLRLPSRPMVTLPIGA
ncbi:MAG TPA: 2-amino-4-hydroxy-6-hydroxymethyldihydropteridine diphosphokinase [Candidatus Limnocylindrales bacterium]